MILLQQLVLALPQSMQMDVFRLTTVMSLLLTVLNSSATLVFVLTLKLLMEPVSQLKIFRMGNANYSTGDQITIDGFGEYYY